MSIVASQSFLQKTFILPSDARQKKESMRALTTDDNAAYGGKMDVLMLIIIETVH